MAAELPVVHLKIRHCAARLTPPAIATQDLLAQTFVRQGIQPQAGGFWSNHSQDAFSRRFSSFVQLHNRSVARLILNVPTAIAGLEFAFLRRR
jgi:hypothetical protein